VLLPRPRTHRRCHFNLPSVEAEEEAHSKMPPIKVKFEIPYFTVSGMQVRVARALCALWASSAVRGLGVCRCVGTRAG
jgi:hypothetical protein